MNLFSVVSALALVVSNVTAFVLQDSTVHIHSSTRLYLENHIADMIDEEVDRLKDVTSWRRKEEAKRKAWSEQELSLPEGFDFNSVHEYQPNKDAGNKIQMRKDKRMAREDPARYCADRCVATGACEVYEDMFELSASEVMKFCQDCVLSEGEDPCDVPDAFLENAGKPSWERTSLKPWDLVEG